MWPCMIHHTEEPQTQLPLQLVDRQYGEISNLAILYLHRGTRRKSCNYRRNKYNFTVIYFFSLKIKQQDLIIQESKNVKRALVTAVFFLTSDPVDFFLKVEKISYQMRVILTKVYQGFRFSFSVHLSMLCKLCMPRQSNNCLAYMKHVDTS